MPAKSDAKTGGAAVRRTVVVTGAAGFLGSHVVELMSDAGDIDVIATDVVRSERTEALASLPGVRFQAVDLRDASAVAEILARCDSVVHLAAVRTKAAVARPREAYDINVGASYDLMSLATAHSVRRFIFGSSQSVYGKFADPHVSPFREEEAAVRAGLSMYAASKLAGEAFLAAFADSGGLQYLSLRFGGLYGPRVHIDSNGGLLLEALQALDGGQRAAIPWARDSVHTLTYVKDAATAVLRALEVHQTCMAVNVVGEPVSAERMYTALAKLAGKDTSELDWRNQRTRYQLVSSERLRTVLGLEQQTSLEDGLSELIGWHRRAATAAAPEAASDAGGRPD
jgi:UDP-glucose 4-epimerase